MHTRLTAMANGLRAAVAIHPKVGSHHYLGTTNPTTELDGNIRGSPGT
jgi:hypothetical protein